MHINVTVTGRVQGVGFRAGAKHKALQLKLTGWVQNQTDGSVYMEIEGDSAKIQDFLVWCKEGSFLSKVTKVVTQPGKMVPYTIFEIR